MGFYSRLMKRLIKMADKQKGISSPNPVTAAAVVQGKQVISFGVHQTSGTAHAEVLALNLAQKQANGATLLVTLEPCTHFGKTPPCVNAILEAGIKRVVYAIRDPNPLVKGHPAKYILEENGVEVIEGVCFDEALELNEVFFKNKVLKRPFVTLKIGCSLDGKIALHNKKSKYITGAVSQRWVHRFRNQVQGLLVGVQTIIDDDPHLNVRLPSKEFIKNPAKIIVDKWGKCPKDATVFKSNEDVPVYIVSSVSLTGYPSNVEVIVLPLLNGQFDWDTLLSALFERGIMHVMVEGGQGILTSLIESKMADKLYLSMAPKLIGGKKSLGFLSGTDIDNLDDSISLSHLSSSQLGDDILVKAYLNHPSNWFPKALLST